MDTPVTSVTKEASTVCRSAAAVFVITNEMIRRSCAASHSRSPADGAGHRRGGASTPTPGQSRPATNGLFANKLLV